MLVVLYVFRRFFVQPLVAWTILNASLLLMGLCAVDKNFQAIVTKPDNVPIVALVFLAAVLYLAGDAPSAVEKRRSNPAGLRAAA